MTAPASSDSASASTTRWFRPAVIDVTMTEHRFSDHATDRSMLPVRITAIWPMQMTPRIDA